MFRRLAQILGIAFAGLALMGLLVWAMVPGWVHGSIDLAKREMASRHYAAAREKLARLAAWWPDWDEVQYLLGVCEEAEGHPDAALQAWARVPSRSPFGPRAALQLGQAAMDRGHLAEAETILTEALNHPAQQVIELRQTFIQLLWSEGRFDEVRPLIEANWRDLCRTRGPAADLTMTTLRAHLSLDLEMYTYDKIRDSLERAARTFPQDDRNWLAQANISIRTGRFEEAAKLLHACLQKRPDDPVVWHSWLELALATSQVDQALAACEHLTTEHVPPEQIPGLQAWFAARLGDVQAEQRFLDQWLTLDPYSTAALERLAELATQSGQTDRAAELRRRKAVFDEAIHHYKNKLGNDFKETAAEMARLAEILGRFFEARAFLTLLVHLQPENQDARTSLARLEQSVSSRRPPSQPLAPHFQEIAALVRSRSSAHAERVVADTPQFDDHAEAAGLRFVYDNGRTTLRQLPETMSGGLALLDYDGDGWLDLYVVQGGPFPPDPNAPGTGDRLFRNRGDGSFQDVTDQAGIASLPRGYGHGVAVADYDNDGHPDLFVTRWRSYALFRNRGDGRFEDVTEAAGLGGDRDWPTSAAWADLDGDGDLDLYVCHYLVWDEAHPRICHANPSSVYSYCNPRLFQSLPDHLFRNDGGRFVDITAKAGLVDTDGRGLGVLAADLDDDGRVDLYVANDGTANFLLRNRATSAIELEEVAHTAGVACNSEGGYQAGMGIACGDLDGDGRPDLAVTNFYAESTTFYQNLGEGFFADRTAAVGLTAVTRNLLGFGVAFLDVNNDGRLDLVSANGNVNDFRPYFPYAMPVQLLLRDASGRLTDLTQKAGPPWSIPRVGRGLAAGDLDNDGRIDLVILSQNEPLAYFHNRTPRPQCGHFVMFQLEGTTSNRDAVGAKVTVEAGGRRQVAQRIGGGSYQSASDCRLHFGLGSAARVDAVEVRWPSRRVERFRDLNADTGYLLREGETEPKPLAGFCRRP